MAKTTEKYDGIADSTMSLGDHLEELRTRLFLALTGVAVALIGCLFFGKGIISFISRPYAQAMNQTDNLVVLGPVEGFASYMKVSLITGLVISSPWVFYQLWMFVAAGLYPRERRYVRMAVPFSATLFVGGAAFFIFIVAPLSIGFLVRFNRWLEFKNSFTVSKYISFVTNLTLVFGIAFQMPIAIFFLYKTGLVSIDALRKSRKFVLLGVFVIAAMATPPDWVSQVTLAVPLYLLFEFGILLSYFAGRKKRDSSKSPVKTE